MPTENERIRVMRVIARLNVGGPAIHVTLASQLDPARYETRLYAGRVGAGEADMGWYAREHGIEVQTVEGLGREIRPLADFATVRRLAERMREFRPHVVHTHTAKAGAVGRAAAILVRRMRRPDGAPAPRIVHTFHGHVLTGYFDGLRNRVFRSIERTLARSSDRLVVPAPRLRDELLALGVGRPLQYAVIPLGFELDPFLAVEPRDPAAAAGPLRAELGVPAGAVLFGAIGRLTAIKDHALLLEAFARLTGRTRNPVHLVLVGDGELRGELEADVARRGLGAVVHFAGWRKELAPVYRELDAVVLSSRNEGTPVVIIEAFAAGRAVVATAVGGVPDLVEDGASGLLVPYGRSDRLAVVLGLLADDAALRAKLAAGGRARAGGFTAERLRRDLDHLYQSVLDGHGPDW